jgi:hypothetical protein
MTQPKKEPTRPAPSSGRTTGVPWGELSDKDFQEKEREMRENIRSSGDFV